MSDLGPNAPEKRRLLIMHLPEQLYAKLQHEAQEKSLSIEQIVRMELRARYGDWGAHQPA